MRTIQALDIAGTIFSLSSTILTWRASILNWPVSLIAIALNTILFYQKGLYANTVLEGVYTAITLYGFYNWYFNQDHLKKVKIRFMSPQTLFRSLFFATVSFVGFYFWLRFYTSSTVPKLDSIVTTMCILGMWAMSKRYIECWALWFVADAFHVAVCSIKQIYAHAIYYNICLIIACLGFMHWHKIYKRQNQDVEAAAPSLAQQNMLEEV